MAPSNEKDLIVTIDQIVNKNTTSPKLKVVEATTKTLEAYLNENKDSKDKPDDLSRVRAALSHLKNAEKEFLIEEKDIYSSGAARSAAKKVMGWIKKNSTDSAGIRKVIDFADKVKKYDKPAKTSTTKTIGAYSVEIAHKGLDLIREILPAGKKEIKEALEAKAEKVVKDGKERLSCLGKAVSGVVSDITSAGADDKCDSVTVKNKKYNKKS